MSTTKTTTAAHDANGFPIALPFPVSFSLEESDVWECSAPECADTDAQGDVDGNGHRYDGPTATQVWTAVPLEGDGDGDVFTGTLSQALAYFAHTFDGAPAPLSCGHAPTPSAISTGSATVAGIGETLCYPCADERQRQDMARSNAFTGYLSQDGKTFTTWTGGELARVTQEGTARTGFYGATITYLRATDANGRKWYGKNGGRGMCVTLRARKGSRVEF